MGGDRTLRAGVGAGSAMAAASASAARASGLLAGRRRSASGLTSGGAVAISTSMLREGLANAIGCATLAVPGQRNRPADCSDGPNDMLRAGPEPRGAGRDEDG